MLPSPVNNFYADSYSSRTNGATAEVQIFTLFLPERSKGRSIYRPLLRPISTVFANPEYREGAGNSETLCGPQFRLDGGQIFLCITSGFDCLEPCHDRCVFARRGTLQFGAQNNRQKCRQVPLVDRRPKIDLRSCCNSCLCHGRSLRRIGELLRRIRPGVGEREER